jgi:hypothetical protein
MDGLEKLQCFGFPFVMNLCWTGLEANEISDRKFDDVDEILE